MWKKSSLCVLSCEENTHIFHFFKHPKQNWSYGKKKPNFGLKKHSKQNWSYEKKKPKFALKKHPEKIEIVKKKTKFWFKETPKTKLKLWKNNQNLV